MNKTALENFLIILFSLVIVIPILLFIPNFMNNIYNVLEQNEIKLNDSKNIIVESTLQNGEKIKYTDVYDYEFIGNNRETIILFFKDGTKITILNSSIVIKENEKKGY